MNKNSIVVRPSHDCEDTVEGGHNFLYRVVACNVDEALGTLVWDRNIFPVVPLASSVISGNEPSRTVMVSRSNPRTNHVRDMNIVSDDVLIELRNRGVEDIRLTEVEDGLYANGLGVECILSQRDELYTVLYRERCWPDGLWECLCPILHCTVNYGSDENPQYVLLFGHFSKEQVTRALHGVSDFTLTQVRGRHHPALPFLPQTL
jgi:hypothetical protein